MEVILRSPFRQLALYLDGGQAGDLDSESCVSRPSPLSSPAHLTPLISRTSPSPLRIGGRPNHRATPQKACPAVYLPRGRPPLGHRCSHRRDIPTFPSSCPPCDRSGVSVGGSTPALELYILFALSATEGALLRGFALYRMAAYLADVDSPQLWVYSFLYRLLGLFAHLGVDLLRLQGITMERWAPFSSCSWATAR